MSLRAKERFIEETGGLHIGESLEQFQQRQKEIQALRDKPTKQRKTLTEVEQARLYELLGLTRK
jgi:hypothetical protein